MPFKDTALPPLPSEAHQAPADTPKPAASSNLLKRFTTKLRSNTTPAPPAMGSSSTDPNTTNTTTTTKQQRNKMKLPTMPKAPTSSAALPNSFTSPEQRQAALRARGLIPSVPHPYKDAHGYRLPLSEQEKELDRRYTVAVDSDGAMGRTSSTDEEGESESKKIREAWLRKNQESYSNPSSPITEAPAECFPAGRAGGAGASSGQGQSASSSSAPLALPEDDSVVIGVRQSPRLGTFVERSVGDHIPISPILVQQPEDQEEGILVPTSPFGGSITKKALGQVKGDLEEGVEGESKRMEEEAKDIPLPDSPILTPALLAGVEVPEPIKEEEPADTHNTTELDSAAKASTLLPEIEAGDVPGSPQSEVSQRVSRWLQSTPTGSAFLLVHSSSPPSPTQSSSLSPSPSPSSSPHSSSSLPPSTPSPPRSSPPSINVVGVAVTAEEEDGHALEEQGGHIHASDKSAVDVTRSENVNDDLEALVDPTSSSPIPAAASSSSSSPTNDADGADADVHQNPTTVTSDNSLPDNGEVSLLLASEGLTSPSSPSPSIKRKSKPSPISLPATTTTSSSTPRVDSSSQSSPTVSVPALASQPNAVERNDDPRSPRFARTPTVPTVAVQPPTPASGVPVVRGRSQGVASIGLLNDSSSSSSTSSSSGSSSSSPRHGQTLTPHSTTTRPSNRNRSPSAERIPALSPTRTVSSSAPSEMLPPTPTTATMTTIASSLSSSSGGVVGGVGRMRKVSGVSADVIVESPVEFEGEDGKGSMVEKSVFESEEGSVSPSSPVRPRPRPANSGVSGEKVERRRSLMFGGLFGGSKVKDEKPSTEKSSSKSGGGLRRLGSLSSRLSLRQPKPPKLQIPSPSSTSTTPTTPSRPSPLKLNTSNLLANPHVARSTPTPSPLSYTSHTSLTSYTSLASSSQSPALPSVLEDESVPEFTSPPASPTASTTTSAGSTILAQGTGQGQAVPRSRLRQPLSPTMHSRGSILMEMSSIEDEESRRLSEMAFCV